MFFLFNITCIHNQFTSFLLRKMPKKTNPQIWCPPFFPPACRKPSLATSGASWGLGLIFQPRFEWWIFYGIYTCSSIWMFPKIVVPPNHPFLIGFSIINHPFWGTPIFGNTHIQIVPWILWVLTKTKKHINIKPFMDR